jgi:hypothetical protein
MGYDDNLTQTCNSLDLLSKVKGASKKYNMAGLGEVTQFQAV